jgi:curved DNA-binding protein CbpA
MQASACALELSNFFSMETQNDLETVGNLRINSLAELLVEIAQTKLNGSLRVTNDAQKIAVYFDAGEAVFAASNSRRHRLYETLLKAERITKDQLIEIADFTNDAALKENLLKNKRLTETEIKTLSSRQIADILQTALAWRDGEWIFSPLVRIKGDIRFPIDLPNLLVEHARSLPAAEIARKFGNRKEFFVVKSAMFSNLNLSPKESFVFSRFEKLAMSVEEILNLSGLPEAETFQILYTLWLGGLLARQKWSAAFTERKVAAILAANLTLKKAEPAPVVVVQPLEAKTKTPETEPETPAEKTVDEPAADEKPVSLEEYLSRVEESKNFYQLFALPMNAAASEIKQTYFGLAKRFHPDLFHKEDDKKLLQRIQSAFSQLAQAYDTLKTESSREVYDFRMRKNLSDTASEPVEKIAQAAVDSQKQFDEAAENFEQGFYLVMREDYESAVPYLARAVHFDKSNARYHAYYGKALSSDDKHRHKAEAALQNAVKLDGQNADYRVMLAEFFIQVKLLKRAEGELKRLLTIHPNNHQARRLLDSLSKK